jgi:hypothetical protein
LTKEDKTCIGEKTASSTNSAGRTEDQHVRLKLDHRLSPYSTTKELKVRAETVKPLQERTGKILEHADIGNNFPNRNPIAQQLREMEPGQTEKLLHSKGNSH